MKNGFTIVTLVLIYLLSFMFIALVGLREGDAIRHEKETDILRAALSDCEAHLASCGDCCNDMNKDLVKFHVRKDSLLVDRYERMGL